MRSSPSFSSCSLVWPSIGEITANLRGRARLSCAEVLLWRACGVRGEREKEINFKSHVSLWEHSSHFRLIGRGLPSVSVVSQIIPRL